MLNDFVTCPICGIHRKYLKAHLNKTHGMTIDEFRIKYPDALTVAPSTHARMSKSTSKRNLENWKDPKYREHTVNTLRDNKEVRMRNWSNSKDRTINPEKYKHIASLGGKSLMRIHGQKYLTAGKLNSEEFHEVHSKLMSRLGKSIHYDPKYSDIRKIVEGPKSGNLIEYKLDNGDIVKLRSTFELRTYQVLEDSGIEFQYEPSSPIFNYTLNDKVHRYYPDFIIPSLNIIIEDKPKCYTVTEVYKLKKASVIDKGFKYLEFTENEVYDKDKMLRLIYET